MTIEFISFGVGCMKVVDAFWEKRNLAVDCYEISIEHDDDVNEIATKIKNLDGKKYIVFKIPAFKKFIHNTFLTFIFLFERNIPSYYPLDIKSPNGREILKYFNKFLLSCCISTKFHNFPIFITNIFFIFCHFFNIKNLKEEHYGKHM